MKTFRKWISAAFLTATVLGCSASSVSAQQVASPAEIQPTWTPVLDPDGSDEYLAHVCYQGDYLILAYGSRHAYGSDTFSAAYGGKC